MHYIKPIYIKDNGEEEPEDVKELKDNQSYELPFPLEKEIGEEEDGWDLRDKAGNTPLKLRFTL